MLQRPKLFTIFAISTLAISLIGCTPQKKEVKPVITSSFEEMPDPEKSQNSVWSNSSKGLNASIISTNKKFAKSAEPLISTPQLKEKLIGWKGEKVHMELLVWSKESLNNIQYEISDFQSANHKLNSDIAKAAFVRYVMTDEFAGGCGYRKPENYVARLSQDILDPITTINLPSQTVRPIWVTIEIPRSAPSGLYRSKITITADNQESKSFLIDLDIQAYTLPTPEQWSYHLDLWQHPAAVARVENLTMWSDEHFEALKKPMQMLANAGQKVITATLNKDPWNNQCYDTYTDMIKWTKHADNKWSYDYKVFDKWIEMMMDLGIDKMINCYSVVPWNNELHYFDAVGDSIVNMKADPGTDLFNDVWHHFFTDFKTHLSDKGWLNITNIAMDERTPKEMEATINMLQKEAPELGISYADNQKSYKKYPFVKDISIEAGATIDPKDLKERKDKGLITTYYVCCSDPFPNMFTFSNPAESVYAGWYALAMNFDGFLRWAYNSWVEKPLLDSRFRTWPAGDTSIIYPGARSSIRFEKLIEGIQDIEKVKILRRALSKSTKETAKETLKRLNDAVATFGTIKPEKDYTLMLEEAKEVINEATTLLIKE